MREKIIRWIREQVKETKVEGVVFGLSGGLDSAVAAFLCSQAVGKRRTLGLILSCMSQKRDLLDAAFIVKRSGIKVRSIDLTSIYKSFLKLLPEAGKITQGNLKARLRMLVLYYFANRLNYLVCGTSNKSELLMGYFTKYGDGATDILPLGNLLKSQVKKLARELNIPQRFINKPPSAGLWPGQTDESELGITYCQLDDILSRLVGAKTQIQPAKLVNKVKFRIKTSEHKRKIPRICKI